MNRPKFYVECRTTMTCIVALHVYHMIDMFRLENPGSLKSRQRIAFGMRYQTAVTKRPKKRIRPRFRADKVSPASFGRPVSVKLLENRSRQYVSGFECKQKDQVSGRGAFGDIKCRKRYLLATTNAAYTRNRRGKRLSPVE
jgi:hypothetical protein